LMLYDILQYPLSFFVPAYPPTSAYL
jgi:hypothetical protein